MAPNFGLQRIYAWCQIVLPFVVLAVFFFGKAFANNEQFLYRDAAHFYYPLFHEVTRQWKAGEIPLWSPWDGIGQPLAADATPSVFYPGKILLLLPWGFGFGMRMYVVGHLALAYGGMFWAARRWNCSRAASILAALTYAFCGPVLSYHANIIFLVGAAWLPFAMVWGWNLARRPALPAGLGLSFSLAMMILGGDAQLAYHTMLMLTLAAIFFVLPWRRLPSWQTWFAWRTVRIGGLIASALFAAGLTAIQILPTSQWVARSVRATSDQPRSVYEVARFAAQGKEINLQNLLGKPKPNTHARQCYDFSIGPWNWPEVLVANFSGQLYPRNERWTRAIPAEGRIWFSSLFMGSLVMLLAAVAVWNASKRFDRWLVAVGAFAVFASLGFYGIGWLWHELAHDYGFKTQGIPIGSPFGGLYWLLNMVLPKYAGFRYPAKWWIFFTFTAAFFSGRGLDVIRISNRWLWRIIVAMGLVAVLGLAVLLLSSSLSSLLPKVENDSLFGPLQASAGISQMAIGLIVGAAAVVMGMAALRLAPRSLGVTIVVLVTMIELALGNRWIAPSANERYWHPNHGVGGIDFSYLRFSNFDAHYFNENASFYPESFSTTSSDDRLIEGMKIDRRVGFSRMHLLGPERVIPSVTSVRPRDRQTIWSWDVRTAKQLEGAITSAQEWSWPAALWKSDVAWHEPIDESTPTEVERGTSEILKPMQAVTKAPRSLIPIESGIRLPSKYHRAFSTDPTPYAPLTLEAKPADRIQLPSAPPKSFVFGKYVRPRSGQIEMDLVGCQPGWVVFREYFDDGWQCDIFDKAGQKRSGVPIYRANRIMMAVPIHAGDTKVVLTYWPRSFVIGAITSSVSFVVLLGLVGYVSIRNPQRGDRKC